MWCEVRVLVALRANRAQQVEDVDHLSHVPDRGHSCCGTRGLGVEFSVFCRASTRNVCLGGAPFSNSRRTSKDPQRCVMPMINSVAPSSLSRLECPSTCR